MEQRARIVFRIQQVIEKAYGGNEAEFCRQFKIAGGTLGHIKDPKKFALTPEFLIEFAEFHRKSLDWLMRKVSHEDLSPLDAEKPTE